jgi:hypothetical protein
VVSRNAVVATLAATLAGVTLVVVVTAGRSTGEGAPRTPVLIELFTSEGCSSCPPADDLLRRLVRDQPIEGVEVIAISEHVDYWNRLGWTDPFSSARFSERQREFSRALRSQLYTPQLVVDGRLEVIGSDWPAVQRAILEASALPRATVAVSAEQSPDGVTVRVAARDLPEQARGESTRIVVALVEDGLVTRVRRGENARRRLRHDAVARVLLSSIARPGDASSAELTEHLRLESVWDVDRLRVVAFLQGDGSGHVLGAATTRPGK